MKNNYFSDLIKMQASIGAADLRIYKSEGLEAARRSQLSKTGFMDEKFMDPLYLCFGRDDFPYLIKEPKREPGLRFFLRNWNGSAVDDQQPVTNVGYEYLYSVPRNAEDRINAIRNKIEKSTNNFPKILEPIENQSKNALRDFADSAISSYKKIKNGADEIKKLIPSGSNKSKDIDLSANLDIEIEGIEKSSYYATLSDDAKSIFSLKKSEPDSSFSDIFSEVNSLSDYAKTLKGSDNYKLIDKSVKEYGPIAKQALKGIKLGIDVATGDSGGSKETTGKVFDFLSQVSLMIPGYGPFISAAMSGISSVFKNAVEAAADFCREDIQKIKDSAYKSIEAKYPIPWHLEQIFDPSSCPKDKNITASGYESTSQQYACLGIYGANYRNFDSNITPFIRQSVRKWWALATMYMSDPRVKSVFNALCWDCNGGTIASDEQVMVVAAPVAVAYGIDVDKFAKELWNYSKGYRSSQDSLASFDESFKSKYGSQFVCAVNTPRNAWWVQLAVLSEDAFNLVEKIKRREENIKKIEKEKLEKELIEKESAKRKSSFIKIAAGIAGSAALFALNAPILIAAAPAAIGIYLYKKD